MGRRHEGSSSRGSNGRRDRIGHEERGASKRRRPYLKSGVLAVMAEESPDQAASMYLVGWGGGD